MDAWQAFECPDQIRKDMAGGRWAEAAESAEELGAYLRAKAKATEEALLAVPATPKLPPQPKRRAR